MAVPNATYDQRAAECRNRGHRLVLWDGIQKMLCQVCGKTQPLPNDTDRTPAVEGASST